MEPVTGSEQAATFKRFEAEGWSARAATYGRLTGRATAEACGLLLDRAGVGAGMRVLDVACGPGHLSAAAAARGATPVGVDLAEGMLEQAREANPGLDLVRGDAEELPFGDAEFDGVFGGFVLNHLPHPERALREAARVARPGAGLAFSVWDRPERTRLIGLLGDAVEAAGCDRTVGAPPGPDGFRFADEAELTALLTDAGLAAAGVDTLELSVHAAGADELWEGLLGGSVRASAAVLAQPPEAQERIRRAFGELAREFERPDGSLSVPAVVRVGSGVRP